MDCLSSCVWTFGTMEVLTAMEHLHCVNLLTINLFAYSSWHGFVGVQYYNIQAKFDDKSDAVWRMSDSRA
jgi:cell division protein FtsB